MSSSERSSTLYVHLHLPRLALRWRRALSYNAHLSFWQPTIPMGRPRGGCPRMRRVLLLEWRTPELAEVRGYGPVVDWHNGTL